MAKVTYVLRNPKSTEETPVILIFREDQQRVKIQTGERINPKHWDAMRHAARPTRKFPRYPEFNRYLENLKNTVKDIHQRLLNDGEYKGLRQVRDILQKQINGEAPKKRITFWQFVDKFMLESESKRKNSTMSTFRTTIRTLKEFEQYQNQKIDFDTIDIDWYDSYMAYLTKVCNYSPNTIGKRIANLKTILNDATEKGYNKNLNYRSKRFKKQTEDTDAIYLTDSELLAMYKLDLHFSKRLEKVRDFFLVGAYTGLRYSDYSRIQPEHIKKDTITIKTQKTGKVVSIPLHWMVRDIMEKYKGITPNSLPPSISQQKLNKYIKEIGELAKINEPILISKTKGGERIDTTFKKWELISSHTARRSFATNAFLNGVPTISIMKITGHNTESAFLRYIRVSPEENAQNLIEHPFFANRAPLKRVK